MPYTKEELKDLAFYQNLINEDEQNYLIERERLQTLVAVSGSGYDGGLLTRDESGTIKLFENHFLPNVQRIAELLGGEIRTSNHKLLNDAELALIRDKLRLYAMKDFLKNDPK